MKKLKEEFEEKVKALNNIGALHNDFGYKMKVTESDGSKTVFTVPDWGNVWKFIKKAYQMGREDAAGEIFEMATTGRIKHK